ncbi:MAG TPA: hypothetical protein VK843_01785 [Planctomycetota bacterium]|nr:hypothetical protein [Planctomycetota bacterium]
MPPLVAFCTAVGFTVAFLTVVVITGLRGRITVHIPCVIATFLSLATTIYFAIKLGTVYDLSTAGVITPIHRTIAILATVSYVLPVITGIRTLMSSVHRRAHFWSAMIVLTLTAAASITGTLMLLWSDKFPVE